MRRFISLTALLVATVSLAACDKASALAGGLSKADAAKQIETYLKKANDNIFKRPGETYEVNVFSIKVDGRQAIVKAEVITRWTNKGKTSESINNYAYQFVQNSGEWVFSQDLGTTSR